MQATIAVKICICIDKYTHTQQKQIHAIQNARTRCYRLWYVEFEKTQTAVSFQTKTDNALRLLRLFRLCFCHLYRLNANNVEANKKIVQFRYGNKPDQ